MPIKRRKQRGGLSAAGIISDVKDVGKMAYDLARRNQILSNALKNTGHTTAGNVAGALGFGRRRKRRVVRRVRPKQLGGFSLGGFLGSITAPFSGALAGASMGAQAGIERSTFGFGRRRRRIM